MGEEVSSEGLTFMTCNINLISNMAAVERLYHHQRPNEEPNRLGLAILWTFQLYRMLDTNFKLF